MPTITTLAPMSAPPPAPPPLAHPSRASRPVRPPRALLAYLETAEQPRDHGSTSYGWAIEELAAVMGEQLVWLLEDPDPSDERTDRAARVRELAELVALAARGLESAARAERADTA